MQDNTNENNMYESNEQTDNLECNVVSDESNGNDINSSEESIDETYGEEIIDIQTGAEETDDELINDDEQVSDEVVEQENLDKKIISEIDGKLKKTFSFFNRIAPEKRIRVISLFVVCFIIILLIFTDIIPILPNAYNRFYVGNTYTIGETQGGVFDKFGENIIYAGNSKVMSFTPDMSCDFSIDAPTGKPMVESCYDNAVVYYENTGNAFVITEKNNAKKLNLKEKITGASITKSGYYGIISDESGYKSCVEIFNKNGTSVYKWHTNSHIIDVSISDDGKSMAAASYEVKNSSIHGKIIFFDLSSDKPVKEISMNSCMVSEVKFIDKATLIAFGDMYTAAYSSKGASLWRIDYKGRVPKCYDVAYNGIIAYVYDRYSSSLSESSVELYNKNGEFLGKYDSRENVKYISCNNGYVLLSLDRQTALLDDDADVVKIKNTSKDYKKAVLYSNYNFAFSITDGVAEVMSVKH